MAWNEISHRATQRKELDPVPAVEGNESRLGQVFLNLIVNAAQAIPEGHAENNRVEVKLRQRDDQRIEVAITDTGAGMPPEVLQRLFTPFFTTKPTGVGTGLGLSICHKIVTGMGGTIEVESKVGRGTTFRVLLRPSATKAVAAVARVESTTQTARRGKILIVDDEPMIGTILRRILSANHDLEILQRATEAAEKIRAGERFDIILCDLMMPEMTGMNLHETLLEIAPEQARAMVFLTGGAFTPSAQTFFERVANRRLDKPFQVQQVQTLVSDLLRALPPGAEPQATPK
jgi:CheY-like chemotaxis protein